MQYQGSKQRLMKIYAPIIGKYLQDVYYWQKGEPPYYVEPFIGGGNSMAAVNEWCNSKDLEVTKIGNGGKKMIVVHTGYLMSIINTAMSFVVQVAIWATAITALFIVLYALLRVINITTSILGEIRLRPSKALRSTNDKPRS